MSNTLQVGKTYTSENGSEWECIFVREGKAWMLGVYPDGASGSAYDFDIDGTASWAGGHGSSGYNIKWGPKVESVSIPATYVVEGGGMRFIFNGHYEYEYKEVFKVSITFELIDGTPDWSTAKVSPCD